MRYTTAAEDARISRINEILTHLRLYPNSHGSALKLTACDLKQWRDRVLREAEAAEADDARYADEVDATIRWEWGIAKSIRSIA